MTTWITPEGACDYLSAGERTETGRRRISPRYLTGEIKAGRLKAARIGGRKQWRTTHQWLDEYAVAQVEPVLVSSIRKRA